jgi:hypothetical protein
MLIANRAMSEAEGPPQRLNAALFYQGDGGAEAPLLQNAAAAIFIASVDCWLTECSLAVE